MFIPKTHFEQVPLEIVKKIVEQQTEPGGTAAALVKAGRKELEKNLVEAIKGDPLMAEVKAYDCSV